MKAINDAMAKAESKSDANVKAQTKTDTKAKAGTESCVKVQPTGGWDRPPYSQVRFRFWYTFIKGHHHLCRFVSILEGLFPILNVVFPLGRIRFRFGKYAHVDYNCSSLIRKIHFRF